VRCVIDMYGIANLAVHGERDAAGKPTATNKLMNDSLADFGAASDEALVFRRASPLAYLAAGAPPVLVLHGRADPTVDFTQSEQLVRVLKERGVEHEFIALDGIGHTFDWETWNKQPLPRDLRPVALAFLAKHLAPTESR
jgi:acetyl esterase/lipase